MASGIAARVMPETVTGLTVGNKSMVCQHGLYLRHDIWVGGNPLNAPTSLMLFQISVISVVSKVFHYALKPLGQISVTSQLLAGIVLGPSCLGRLEYISSDLFPMWGVPAIETFTTFGVMFFIFGLGVKMDPTMMVHPDRRSAVIGGLMLLAPLMSSVCCSLYLTTHIPMDTSLARSLAYVAGAQSMTGFPVVSLLVTELGILNTDLGRLAISSAMFCDMVNIVLSAIGTSLTESEHGTLISSIMAFVSVFALLLALVFLVKPLVLWVIDKTPPGKPMPEIYLMFVFVIVLVTGFVSESIGQHYILGPLFLGLLIPDGPPLGTAIETRAEALISGLLYPTFVSINGLQTDIYSVNYEHFWIIGTVSAVAFSVKFVAVFCGCLYVKVPLREAVVLALISETKGIMELVLFNIYKNADFMSNEAFSLCIASVVLVTGITTPVIKLLYDPSRQYISVKRCTIQHSKHDSEFRILVCIQNQESVPALINLLEVSHSSKDGSILVMVMVLVELVGRTTPVLVNHKDRALNTSASMSGQITNAFNKFGHNREGFVTVETFTAISEFASMHDNICQVALEEGAHIVVVPFHKQWSVDGSVESVKPQVRTMNLRVLESAPCSVGILIDRGPTSNTIAALNSQSSYHVAVLFIGGPDDAESLAYGSRMAKHDNVILTVIRFLLFGTENTKDRRLDTELIYEYRQENMGNERFVYIEEVVRDGVGLAAFLRGLVDSFDLIIVGRHHQASPIFMGLDQWSECPEIGIVPDMLASADFESTASVLVVQQQRVGGNFGANQPIQSGFCEEPPRGSWAISIDKFGQKPKELS